MIFIEMFESNIKYLTVNFGILKSSEMVGFEQLKY